VADKKLFFALWPSDRQRDQLRDTINPTMSSVEGVAVDRRNWHVTLVFVGDFPEERVAGLMSAVQVIDPGDIRLRFDRLSFWQRPKVAVMQTATVSPELQRLVTSLEQALLPFGFTPHDRVYRPHITVSRKVRAFSEIRLARPIELRWSGFELVESRSVRGDINYTPLKQ
jgi:2'-5' RNA ligase